MRVYFNSGNRIFDEESFREYLADEDLRLSIGEIVAARIDGRRFLSNRGDALIGGVKRSDGSHTGLNIGQLPRSDGYKNYMLFLDEMACRKLGHLYLVDSIVGKLVVCLDRGDNVAGYVTPKGLLELADETK